MPANNRAELIAAFRAFPEQLTALVAGLTEDQLKAAPLPGEWSVWQNVHHVADSHLNAFIRVKKILTEDNPTLLAYDQDVWATTADMNTPIEDSLLILRGLHSRFAALFDSLDETQWTGTGHHSENGVMTTQQFLDLYAAHGEAHLDQIRKTLAAAGIVR